jgi:hypothetical protein
VALAVRVAPMSREPTWCDRGADCTGTHHSRAFSVGAPSRDGGRGQVTVWLLKNGPDPTLLAVNSADGVGFTSEISLEQARLLKDYLETLLRLADTGRGRLPG